MGIQGDNHRMIEHPCKLEETGKPCGLVRQCRLCWLFAHDQRYRSLWGGEGPAVPPQRPYVESRVRCKHLGEVTGEVRECGTCNGRVRLKVFACAEPSIGKTTLQQCKSCTKYRGNLGPRHLLFHLYPANDWRWNVDRIVERQELFDGKRIVAIVTDPPSGRRPDPTGHLSPDRGRLWKNFGTVPEVKERFGPGFEFLELENDPYLREVVSLVPMLERLQGLDGVALYAHGKGTTRAPGHTARVWAEALVETCLDHWPLVQEQLSVAPVTGAFLKLGQGWRPEQSRSDWHYSGSWFWFRLKDLFAKDWRRHDSFWSAIEPYPSQHFDAKEAGCLFFEGRVPQMNLYHWTYWHQTVLPELERWREQRAGTRTSSHGNTGQPQAS